MSKKDSWFNGEVWFDPEIGCYRMELMPDRVRAMLPPLGANDNEEDPIAVVKYFKCDWGWRWYAFEFDGHDTFYGYVEGDSKELGYLSLSQLKNLPGLPMERDRFFNPTRLSELKAGIEN